MHARGDVGPPEKCLHERRAVVGAHLQFDDTPLPGCRQTPCMPFMRRHRVVVAAPDGLRAVGVFLDFKIHRQKRRGAMMLRPVELDAAGNPRPGQPDQRGLDDALVVNQIVAVGLVLNRVDAPADFRQHHHAEKFIFDPDRLPFAVHRLFRDAVGEGQGINLAAAALINPLFQKHRVLVRRRGQIGRDDQFLLPGGHERLPNSSVRESSRCERRRTQARLAGVGRQSLFAISVLRSGGGFLAFISMNGKRFHRLKIEFSPAALRSGTIVRRL